MPLTNKLKFINKYNLRIVIALLIVTLLILSLIIEIPEWVVILSIIISSLSIIEFLINDILNLTNKTGKADEMYYNVSSSELLTPEVKLKLTNENIELKNQIRKYSSTKQDGYKKKINENKIKICENNKLLGIKPYKSALWNKIKSTLLFKPNTINCNDPEIYGQFSDEHLYDHF